MQVRCLRFRGLTRVGTSEIVAGRQSRKTPIQADLHLLRRGRRMSCKGDQAGSQRKQVLDPVIGLVKQQLTAFLSAFPARYVAERKQTGYGMAVLALSFIIDLQAGGNPNHAAVRSEDTVLESNESLALRTK